MTITPSWGDPATIAARVLRDLEHEPGMVRLFQIGYRILCTIPVRCAEAIFRSQTTRRRPQDGYVETDPHRIMKLVKESQYSEAKLLIDDLPTDLYGAPAVALRILIDATPCFPHMLEDILGSKSIYVKKGYRHISTVEDIATINAFLDRL